MALKKFIMNKNTKIVMMNMIITVKNEKQCISMTFTNHIVQNGYNLLPKMFMINLNDVIGLEIQPYFLLRSKAKSNHEIKDTLFVVNSFIKLETKITEF